MTRNLLLGISAATLALLTLSVASYTVQSQEKPKVHSQNAIAGKPLPAVFASVLPRIKARSHVPILLPGELPQPIATAKHAVVEKAEGNEYATSLYYELGVGDSGFAALFSAQHKPKSNPRELPNVEPTNLAHGIHGFFRAVSCGGSCAPANLWWKEDGVLYQIQLELSPWLSDERQERAIVKVADSAIIAGPR